MGVAFAATATPTSPNQTRVAVGVVGAVLATPTSPTIKSRNLFNLQEIQNFKPHR